MWRRCGAKMSVMSVWILSAPSMPCSCIIRFLKSCFFGFFWRIFVSSWSRFPVSVPVPERCRKYRSGVNHIDTHETCYRSTEIVRDRKTRASGDAENRRGINEHATINEKMRKNRQQLGNWHVQEKNRVLLNNYSSATNKLCTFDLFEVFRIITAVVTILINDPKMMMQRWNMSWNGTISQIKMPTMSDHNRFPVSKNGV